MRGERKREREKKRDFGFTYEMCPRPKKNYTNFVFIRLIINMCDVCVQLFFNTARIKNFNFKI